MAFRVRDLMITVLPAGFTTEEPCDAGSEHPPGPPPPPPGPDPGPDSGWRVLPEAEVMLEIRAELQTLLARLGGPVSPAELAPRSLADLDTLEVSLAGALEEVRALRSRFS